MMVSSPGGWGLGMSGDAYVNWFQPLERFHTPRTLINSHFTWLVEFSWAWRYLYVFAWLTLLGTLLCVAVKGGGAVALAVWVSAGISAFFNAVLEDWAVWVPLALALACSLPSVRKACSLKIFAGMALLAASVSALLPVGAFFLAKGGDNAVPVCYDGARVEINGKNPSVWVVDDQWAFCGGYGGMLGKEIRTYFLDNPESGALGYVRDIAHLPGKIDRLALIGKSGEAFYRQWKENPSALPEADEVVFLSPPFPASRISAEFRGRFGTTVVHGGMTGLVAGNSDPIPDWVRIVPGAELYIPGWLDAVLGDR